MTTVESEASQPNLALHIEIPQHLSYLMQLSSSPMLMIKPVRKPQAPPPPENGTCSVMCHILDLFSAHFNFHNALGLGTAVGGRDLTGT
jgi:hypothetical protein